MDWDRLRIFHAVAEAGSFTRAGDVLNLSQSAVSRQISGLEDSLETPLFHRHARGLMMTGQGEILYNTVHEVFGKLALTEAKLRESKDRPVGDLRITATLSLGLSWLSKHIADFSEAYPDIDVRLILQDSELDLSMRQADVAIRLSQPTQQDLVMRPLFEVHHHLYASERYISERGKPNCVADLDNHRLISFDATDFIPPHNTHWLLNAGRDKNNARTPYISINNQIAIKHVVQAGAGIALLPDFMVYERDQLEQLYLDEDCPTISTYFVYPEELRHVRRIQVLRDFILERVSQSMF